MRNETSVTIDPPPERVWPVLMEVESWPGTWTVTEVVAQERFVWEARGPRFRTAGIKRCAEEAT
jgi:hypothetical protein